MASDSRGRWILSYGPGHARPEVPAVQGEAWGRRPEPPPPRRLEWQWHDYYGCFIIALSVFPLAMAFRGFLLDDEYSIVNVVALLLTRLHMLVVMKSSPAPSGWTALALLPTCPAPAISSPPVCYEAMVLPGSTGSANSKWRSGEHDGDYKAAKKCFDSLVRDAAWACDEHDNDYKAAMKCFYILVRNAATICFVGSYDANPLSYQSDDEPPPT